MTGEPNIALEPCPTCGAKSPDENEYCSDGFHAKGPTYWPTDIAMEEADRSAWLIEMESDCLSRGSVAYFGAHYWHPKLGFSHDIDEALQFARKQDAEAFKREYKIGGKVTEHMWPALRAQSMEPTEVMIEAGTTELLAIINGKGGGPRESVAGIYRSMEQARIEGGKL